MALSMQSKCQIPSFSQLSRQPLLTSIHCVCHRLALAAAQAGSDVPYIRDKFKPTLSQLFHFYHNSSVRMSGLEAI